MGSYMDLRDLLQRMQEAPHGSYQTMGWKWARVAAVVVLVVGTLMTSVYTVPTDSAGVVQRFGSYNRTTQPGIQHTSEDALLD